MVMIAFDKYGETPLEDISGLKQKKITTRKQLDDAESLNINKAYLAYLVDPTKLKKVLFTLQFFQQLHHQMYHDVWTWAGEIRTVQTSIGVEAHLIRNRLYQLSDDLNYWGKAWEYQDVATKLHHTLVYIHPFLNGNGRWSRLLTEVWLLKMEKPLPSWSIMHTTDNDTLRKKYIDALKSADQKDYQPLKEFMFNKQISL